MAPTEKPDLQQVIQQLPELLKKLEKATQPSATAADQQAAFGLGCSLLTSLLSCLDQSNPTLTDIEKQADTFVIGISQQGFDDFLKKEADLLKKLKFNSKLVDRALKIMARDQKNEELRDVRPKAKDVIAALTEFRDILCAIEVQNKKGLKVSTELAEVGYDAAFTTLIIAGDTLVIPFAMAGGNIGGVMVGIASIGVGVKNLWKYVRKGKELFKRDQAEHTIAELKKKAPGPRLKPK